MRSTVLWALADCNNFYASCERLFRPDLANCPVVVLSNNDGCIVARSNEAKALGIPAGAPEFQVRDLLKKYGVAVFSSNYALYGDISARVMRVLAAETPALGPHSFEPYSIDEAFLPLNPGWSSAQSAEWALALRAKVLRWTGIAVSIGIGPSRTLAKLAGSQAKKAGGVFVWPREGGEALLAATPVGGVWGIGRRSVPRLAACGIFTAEDLRRADSGLVRRVLSITGVRTGLELNGQSCLDGFTLPVARHSLVSSRSFGRKITEKAHLAEALAHHAARAAERLRREGLVAGRLVATLRTSRHGPGKRYKGEAECVLSPPTSVTGELVRATVSALERVHVPGLPYAKAGIVLYDLAEETTRQLTLFEPEKEADARSHKLMETLDSINRRYGRGCVRHAAEGIGAAPWRMMQAHRSPRATTCWEELPVVRLSAAGT